MKQTILNEEYYCHNIVVMLNSAQDIKFVPDNVKEFIFNRLTDCSTGDDFSEEETGGYSGSWRIQLLSHPLLHRISKWTYNRSIDERLTEELFVEHFGTNDGKHFYSKWEHTYNFDFMDMIAYFGISYDNGQIFCDMLMKMVEKYEKRQSQISKT